MMLPEINLLPKKERQSSFYFYLLLGLLILCLLVVSYVLYAHFQTKGQLEQATKKETTLIEKETTLQAKKTELDKRDEDTLEEAVERTKKQVFPTSILMNHLLVLLPEEGYLREYTYNFGAVEIHAHFETMNEISTYIERLLEDAQAKEVNTFRLKDTGEVGRETREAIDTYYEKTPRYDAVFELQMNRESIQNLEEEQVNAILEEILGEIDEGANANE